MNFISKVWKSGNSLVITIPSTYIKNLEIDEGSIIDLTLNNYKLRREK